MKHQSRFMRVLLLRSSMRLRVAVLAIACLMITPTTARAAESDIFGDISRSCEDLLGISVFFKPRFSRDLRLISVSRSDNFTNVYVNDGLFARLPSNVSEFELFSACGRTSFLDLDEPAQTLESDCWAARSLIRTGRWSRSNLQGAIDWYYERGADSVLGQGMPSNEERAKRMYTCGK